MHAITWPKPCSWVSQSTDLDHECLFFRLLISMCNNCTKFGFCETRVYWETWSLVAPFQHWGDLDITMMATEVGNEWNSSSAFSNVVLRPQRPYWPLGTGSPGGPPQVSHSSELLVKIQSSLPLDAIQNILKPWCSRKIQLKISYWGRKHYLHWMNATATSMCVLFLVCNKSTEFKLDQMRTCRETHLFSLNQLNQYTNKWHRLKCTSLEIQRRSKMLAWIGEAQ